MPMRMSVCAFKTVIPELLRLQRNLRRGDLDAVLDIDRGLIQVARDVEVHLDRIDPSLEHDVL